MRSRAILLILLILSLGSAAIILILMFVVPRQIPPGPAAVGDMGVRHVLSVEPPQDIG